MLNIFKNFFIQKNKYPISEDPIKFTDLAIARIKTQLESRPIGIHSGFKILVQYKKDRHFVQVGFDEIPENTVPIFSYPIPLIITKKDELFLRGSLIDYIEEEKAFFVYPEIEIYSEETPNFLISRYFVNRRIVHENSPISEIGISKEGSGHLPIFLKNIFLTGIIESVYIKENWIQIEFQEGKKTPENQEKVAETLFEYYEKCAYPLWVEGDSIKVQSPAD